MRKELSFPEFTAIVASINTPQPLSSLLSTIMETTKNSLGCEGCSLLLYNKESDCLEFQISRGQKSESLQSLKVPKGKGIAGYVMDTLETVIVNDAQADPRLYKEIDQKVGFVTKNLLCVPMLAKGVFIGVLEAVNTLGDREFDSQDAQTLQNISEIAAIAIHNRYLFDEVNSRLHEINGLLKVSQSLSQVKDTEEFFRASAESISEFLGVQRLSFVSKDSKTGKWKIRFSMGLPFKESEIDIQENNGVIGHILFTKEPLLVENTTKEDVVPFPFANNYKSKSFISVPILIEDKVIGILNVTDKWNQKAFNKTDLKLLKIITNYMMEVYQAIVARVEKDRYLQIERDLETARKFQLYSLPPIPEKLDQLELAACYIASKEIGGDFYDLIYHWEGLYTLVIADVAGKGISSALFMELSKTVINAQISRNIFPGIGLYNSHKILQEKLESNMLVEAMAIQIDTEERFIKIASAGHNRQFYWHKSSQKLELLRSKGVPLGSRISIPEFPEYSFSYETGDLLLLFTDGVTECLNPKGEMFGEDRLSEILILNSDKPVSYIKDKIQEATFQFQGGSHLRDDYTLVIVRFD